MLLSPEFLSKYPDMPPQMKPIGSFVFYRTYSRWLEDYKRRESVKEMHARSTNYNVDLGVRHMIENGIPFDFEEMEREAEVLFHNRFNLKQELSGRTMWVGGANTGVAEKFPLSNFNCSFTNIQKWRDLAELFYLLLVGTGVGFKITKAFAAKLPPLRADMKILHETYRPKPPEQREEDTAVKFVTDDFAQIIIGDSKEAWVSALDLFLQLMTESNYHTLKYIEFNYDNIREKGERLKTFGGTASGHEPLKSMFEGFERVIKGEIDPHLKPWEKVEKNGNQHVRLRPVGIVDMANLVGYNVVVGGVRRTAEIALFDSDDWECIFAKYSMNGFWKEEHFKQHEELGKKLEKMGLEKPGWWDEVGVRNYDVHYKKDIGEGILVPEKETFNTFEEARDFAESQGIEEYNAEPFNFGRPLHHRRMSNNSVAFTSKPQRKILNFLFSMMRLEGEPGFINLEEAARRRLARGGIKNPSKELMDHVMMMIGLNPCAEILLWSKGVCNLTTINVPAFVVDGKLDEEGLLEAQRLSVRAGIRMTLVKLELPEWNQVQQRDRLLGNSMTGWYDAMDQIRADKAYERRLLKKMGEVAREEAISYAARMRIPVPLLDTTVKPEGTISQMWGSVSPGLHRSKGRHYKRHIRINAADALARTVRAMGWPIYPEVGTPGSTFEEQMKNANTYVVAFPVATGAITTEEDITVDDQFDTYFDFQKYYTSHNSSNTITIKDAASWDRAEERVWKGWDQFVGVSFLALDGGTYQLAPYEKITQEEYMQLSSDMMPFEPILLKSFEDGTLSETDLEMTCKEGACGFVR